jgi:hypothetical protein
MSLFDYARSLTRRLLSVPEMATETSDTHSRKYKKQSLFTKSNKGGNKMSLSNQLQKLIQEKRTQSQGDAVVTAFNSQCIKALDPSCLTFTYYVADLAGEKFNKPRLHDGTPNPHWPMDGDKPADVPRDPKDRQEFFQDIKCKTMQGWIDRLNSGEFDQVSNVPKSSPSAPSSDPVIDEHQDVGDLDMTITDDEPEAEQPVEGVVIDTEKETAPALDASPQTFTKTGEEEEIEAIKRSIVGIGDNPLHWQLDALVHYNEKVGTPPVVPLMNAIKLAQTNFEEFRDKLSEYKDTINELKQNQSKDRQSDPEEPHPVIRLREAIEDLARGVVGPATDESLEERLTEIEAKLSKHGDAIKKLTDFMKNALGKVPEMIKAEILKRFS